MFSRRNTQTLLALAALATYVTLSAAERPKRADTCESGSVEASLVGREYVPPDALLVSVVFPRRTLSRPELAGAPIERVLRKIGHLDRAVETPVPARFLEALGIELGDVEQVIGVVTGIRVVTVTTDRSLPMEDDEWPLGTEAEETPYTGQPRPLRGPDPELSPWLYGPLMEAYVVRLSGSAPRQAAVELLFRPREITLAGKTYYGQGKESGALALWFPDEKTMIVGEERVIRKMIVAKKTPTALSRALGSLDLRPDFVGLLHMAAVIDQLAQYDSPWRATVEGTTLATLSIRFDSRPSAGLLVRGSSVEAAARLERSLRNGIATARKELAGNVPGRARPEVNAVRTLIRDLAARGLGALKLERLGDRVEVTLADFAPLTDLTAWLRLFDRTTLRHAVAAWPAVREPATDPTEATIRRLIPAAAGVPAEIMARIGSSQAVPRPDAFIKDPALSVIPMLYKIHPPGLYAKHAGEFRFDLSKGSPHPSGLFQELSRNQYLGYCSVIQPDRITDFTCNVDGETAKGSVSFRVPRLWQGKVRYVAERTDGRWRVKEFQLPIHRWRFVRTERGTWKWFCLFGDVTTLAPYGPPGQPISGRITYGGRPLEKGTIQFLHTVAVQFMGIGSIRDGAYRTELPPGSYFVAILSSVPEVPKKYRSPGQSGLKIEVKQGESVIDFDLTAE